MQNHTMQDKKRKCNSSAPASMARCVALCLFMALAMLFATNAQAKIYLVAVGISDYPGVANDLTLPANDAKTIAWLYSQNSHVKYSLLRLLYSHYGVRHKFKHLPRQHLQK